MEIIGGKQSTRAYVGLIAQGDLIVVIPPIDEQKQIASSIIWSNLTADKILTIMSLLEPVLKITTDY